MNLTVRIQKGTIDITATEFEQMVEWESTVIVSTNQMVIVQNGTEFIKILVSE